MMLRSLATLYEDTARQRMKQFLLMLEPIAILLIGVAAIGLPSLRELDPPTNVGSPREP